MTETPESLATLDLVSLLAAIDSIFWDQYGCLSSRIHFVEEHTGGYSASDYGRALAEKIRLISHFLPRGAIPLHGLHNRYEKYAAMNSMVELCSTYEDDFLVVVDRRPWSQSIFSATVNDCLERTIVVRPIDDLAAVYQQYLPWIPRQNLQTMSVAIDGPGQSSWSDRFRLFVDQIGGLGVTAVRGVGRSPFPQMAYSWDGYLPIDLVRERPAGWFTTVEFENNYQEILETYRLFIAKGVNY